jgi:hypothetical protein
MVKYKEFQNHYTLSVLFLLLFLVLGIRKKITSQRCDEYFVTDKETGSADSGAI